MNDSVVISKEFVMTHLESRRGGLIFPEVSLVDVRENVAREFIRDGVVRGSEFWRVR